MFFSTSETLFFPPVQRIKSLYAYRPDMFVDETANAAIAPGPTPSEGEMHTFIIKDFHVAIAYAHEGALLETAT